MTKDEWYRLELGDVVRNTLSGFSYLVANAKGNKVLLVRTIEASNPVEWDIVRKGTWIDSSSSHLKGE